MRPETGFFEAFASIPPWAVVIATAGALLAGAAVLFAELRQPSLDEQVIAPRDSGLRHAIVNLVGFAVVLAGAIVLVATNPPGEGTNPSVLDAAGVETNPPGVDAPAAECESDSGAKCSGDGCCANANGCYSAAICLAALCANNPGACGGQEPDDAAGGAN